MADIKENKCPGNSRGSVEEKRRLEGGFITPMIELRYQNLRMNREDIKIST